MHPTSQQLAAPHATNNNIEGHLDWVMLLCLRTQARPHGFVLALSHAAADAALLPAGVTAKRMMGVHRTLDGTAGSKPTTTNSPPYPPRAAHFGSGMLKRNTDAHTCVNPAPPAPESGRNP